MELKQVTTECGVTISFSKTKLLVAAGNEIMESNLAPLRIGCSVVESYDKVALDLELLESL